MFRTDGRSGGRSVYGHMITKFSGMGTFSQLWGSAHTRFAKSVFNVFRGKLSLGAHFNYRLTSHYFLYPHSFCQFYSRSFCHVLSVRFSTGLETETWYIIRTLEKKVSDHNFLWQSSVKRISRLHPLLGPFLESLDN